MEEKYHISSSGLKQITEHNLIVDVIREFLQK
jgi:uncharacterized protein (UPF0303 family)